MLYQGINVTDPYYNQGGSNLYSGETTLLEDYRKRLKEMKPSGEYLGGVTAPKVEYPSMPTYNLGRERTLQQQYAAPGMAQARMGLREALQESRNKPLPAASYMAGKSLEGYATGVGGITAAALAPAQQSQMKELGLERENLQGKYGAEYQNAINQYNLSLRQAMQQESERATLEEMIRKMELEKYEAARGMGKPLGTSYTSAGESLEDEMARFRAEAEARHQAEGENWWAKEVM